MKIKEIWPTRSAIAHLRFVFSAFLLPVYLFALSQTPAIIAKNAILCFIIWHLMAFPASNGYNSYFDRDEDSIGLLEKPPEVDISLYYFSLLLELCAFLFGLIINWQFAVAVLLYGIMSKLYSHSKTRLKKYPVISFLTVFVFQGCFIYWSTYAALANLNLFDQWNIHFIIGGLICSFLIGSGYTLTQVYQHDEDSRRGDHTLSLMLGHKGSFIFSGLMFAAGVILSFVYWRQVGLISRFYLFLACVLPTFLFFNYWFYQVNRSVNNANYKNAMRMNFISAGCMLVYFGGLAACRLLNQ